jgi:hypothetical protein
MAEAIMAPSLRVFQKVDLSAPIEGANFQRETRQRSDAERMNLRI